ncbi:hemerythrin domain-containing protein [Denitromonas iodatirespirans]|uniref:Hemerythrin domain-containing protein n=1 Tax=Denitromonas iodatirespirans TaxID=2795389 RepID=A0A944DGL1_DENI1|nr:hemerythrin domain-containing protein [Denitromonas iodatirespirans]MBT0963812.1 hemerythrin domain-containing protein [Denitromonas iodatirespirans]
MRPEAIQIIKDEHFAIAAVMYSLRYLVRKMRDEGEAPNFPLLHAILDYIVSYPDRWHHPKENDYLFAAVKARTRDGDALIARLAQEHVDGHPRIEALKQKLSAFEQTREGAPFYREAESYAEREWAHMRCEEDQLIPLAERVLTTEDWQRIHAAFRENDNPLYGLKPKEDAERLYRKILELAPAPIGYGNK